MKPHRFEAPPLTGAVFPPMTNLVRSLVRVAVVVLLVGVAVPSVAADPVGGRSIHRFNLQSGLTGEVDAAGGLVLLRDDFRTPLLKTELDPQPDMRRRRNGDVFHTVVSEGVPGGHRGFSSRADDDGDGRIDEDYLDGRDNDQDGAIDEDFAAISDAMVAVHFKDSAGAGRGAHLEYYHWSHSHLASTVFLNVARGSTAGGKSSYLLGSAGSDWLESGTAPVAHTGSGGVRQDSPRAFVCRVDLADNPTADPCTPGSYQWLGVMILSENPANRFRASGDQLRLPLDKKPVSMVICASDSWLQLNRMLGEAKRVFEGMTDPVNHRTTPWLVPAGCSACRVASSPEFSVKTGSDGGLELAAEIISGQSALLDPDLFRVDGRALGAPREIRWKPAGGEEKTVPWSCQTTSSLKQNGLPLPFALTTELMGHQTEGRLTFVFAQPLENRDSGQDRELTGRYIDGRPLMLEMEAETPSEVGAPRDIRVSHDPEPEAVEETASRYAEDRARFLEAEQNRFSLSPELLIGWPNPFNDNINIRFTVPRTMKEAFIWKDKEYQPAEIDLEGDVPWPSGRPGVSVKIYNVNGQELVTLHSASESPGEYTVHWNGTDAFGRKVASGPYFCKLQMDDWSVTRQFVFLR